VSSATELAHLFRALKAPAAARAMRSRFVASERDLGACRCNHARKEEGADSVGGRAPEC
jgi:hypothetical protein